MSQIDSACALLTKLHADPMYPNKMPLFVEKLAYKRYMTNPELDGFQRHWIKDGWEHKWYFNFETLESIK